MNYSQGMVVADISQLPPHITFEQYQELRKEVFKYYKENWTEKRQQIVDRDILLIDYVWETGGRIGDVVKITYNNFNGRDLMLYTKKRKKNVVIAISDSSTLIEDTLRYMQKYEIKGDERLFPMTKQNAWGRIKRYGKKIDFPEQERIWKNGRKVVSSLRPHLFRHGIAIHLLNQGVQIPIISARLGHANPYITMKLYMKVTPSIQRKNTEHVQWR